MRRAEPMERLRALAIGVGLVGGLVGVAGGASAAGPVTFGPITATSTFASGIDVGETVTASTQVSRTEILVTTGSSPDASVSDATATPGPSGGVTTLSYRLKTPAGAIIPNTPVHARFRLTFSDGTEETGPEATVRYEDTRFTWKTFQGSIVTVHWIQGDDAFGKRAAAIGDSAIAAASQLLGVHETDPIDFFIYPDVDSFRQVLGPALRENVGGVAFPDIRTLFAQIAPGDVDASWVGIVVPHELTHLVFDTATGNPFHSPPHWMNEGLAVYLSQGFDSSDRSDVADAASSGTLMPLTALAGQFPTAGDRFGLAYAESVSAIDFLVSTYGKPALVALIVSYAQGRTDDEAFKAALGVDMAGFEAAWVKGLGVAEPIAVGPKPAPRGAVPPGWTAGGAVAGTPAPGSSAGTAPAGSGGTGELSWLPFFALGLVVIVVVVAVAARRARRAQPPSASAS